MCRARYQYQWGLHAWQVVGYVEDAIGSQPSQVGGQAATHVHSAAMCLTVPLASSQHRAAAACSALPHVRATLRSCSVHHRVIMVISAPFSYLQQALVALDDFFSVSAADISARLDAVPSGRDVVRRLCDSLLLSWRPQVLICLVVLRTFMHADLVALRVDDEHTITCLQAADRQQAQSALQLWLRTSGGLRGVAEAGGFVDAEECLLGLQEAVAADPPSLVGAPVSGGLPQPA